MYRRQDFIYYLPMNKNANDYSLNNFTTTVNGATLSTNQAGISDMAYSFDGVNDEITMGISAYDAVVSAVNSGVVSFYFNMINNAASNKNDQLLIVMDAVPDFNKAVTIGEIVGSSNYHALHLGGGGSNSQNIWGGGTPTTGVWKRMIYESTYATTKYTGRILRDGTALSLTRTETNQIISGSGQASRKVTIGWIPNAWADRSFKGKMNNVFAIKKALTSTDRAYIAQFGNYKRIA